MDIPTIKNSFGRDLGAAITPEAVEQVKIRYLGRKQGIITIAFNELAGLSGDEKRRLGPLLNGLKSEIERALDARERQFSTKKNTISFDYPAERRSIGRLHPLTQTQNELEDIFRSVGFRVAYGPEIETDWYNFTALNIPEGHPARDMWDTFYIKDRPDGASGNILLRTHTSPMQVRFMEKQKPPFAVIIPGTCYRHEATDATHEHTLQQLEGLVVGTDITFANMVWTLEFALKKFFGDEVKIKLRPSYFPFVEPGAEVSMSSPKFKNGQWVEILGCGMVNQKVFEAVGYPANTYQGFAFGFGLTRFALMKHGVPDIRMFAENKLGFLNQF